MTSTRGPMKLNRANINSGAGSAADEKRLGVPESSVSMKTGAPVAAVVDDPGVGPDLFPGPMAPGARVSVPTGKPVPMRLGGKPLARVNSSAPASIAASVVESRPVEPAGKGGPGLLSAQAVTPLLANKILDVGYEMSVVQAMRPNAKDETGYSNADYAFGGVLAVTGNVEASALLLSLYPRQAEERGLTRQDLAFAMPPEFQELPARSAAIALLRRDRENLRGAACWAEMDARHVFVMTYAQDWAETLPLRRNGTRTTTGFILPKENLPRLLADYSGELINRDGLVRLADRVAQEGRKAQAEVRVDAAISVTATKRSDGKFLVSWSNPFSPVGEGFREVVRGLNGDFVKESKSWALGGREAKLLPLVAAGIDADFATYPFHGNDLRGQDLVVAENLRNGITTLEVAQVREGVIDFGFVGTQSKLSELLKQAGAVSQGGRFSIKAESVGALVGRLESATNVDSSALLDGAMEGLRTQTKVLERVIAMNEDVNAVTQATPTGLPFYFHQKEGIRFLWSIPTPGGILGDDMGLGKTMQALVYANDRFQNERRLLVPPSSLKRNWEKEIAKFIGVEEAKKAQVIRNGKEPIRPGVEWLIVNYDLLAKRKEELMAWKPTLLVADEAHKLKGNKPESGWSKALLGYREKTKDPKALGAFVPGIISVCSKRLALTGTPIQNRVEELWNYLIFCCGSEEEAGSFLGLDKPIPGDPQVREKNFKGFANRYCDAKQVQISAQEWKWDTSGASNLDDLGRRMAPIYLRRTKEELKAKGLLGDFKGKLPQQSIPVELSAAEMKTYHAAVARLLGNVSTLLGEDMDGVDQEFLDRMIRSSEKVQDGALAEASALRQVTALMKIPTAIEEIRSTLEAGKKIIVFSNYIAVLDALQAEFSKPSKDVDGRDVAPIKIARVDGSVSGDRREAQKVLFQEDPRAMIFLGQTKAAGEGLNLTAADEVLTVDRPWTPGAEDQCEDRANRIGQTNLVTCKYLDAEGTFDDDLREILRVKRETIMAFEKGAGEAPRVSEVDTLRDLLIRLRAEQQTIKHAKKGKK